MARSPLDVKAPGHLLEGLPLKHMRVSDLEQKISQFSQVAIDGLKSKTVGVTKLAKSVLRESLDEFRAYSKMGVCHKEQLAVLSVDIRDSSKLAIEIDPELVFHAIQCYLPL